MLVNRYRLLTAMAEHHRLVNRYRLLTAMAQYHRLVNRYRLLTAMAQYHTDCKASALEIHLEANRAC